MRIMVAEMITLDRMYIDVPFRSDLTSSRRSSHCNFNASHLRSESDAGTISQCRCRREPDRRAAKSRASVRSGRKVRSTRWIAALPCRQDNDRCAATAHIFADCLRRVSALLGRHTSQTVFSRISQKPFLASRTPSLRIATFFIPQCNNDVAISREFALKGLQHEVDRVTAMPVAYG